MKYLILSLLLLTGCASLNSREPANDPKDLVSFKAADINQKFLPAYRDFLREGLAICDQKQTTYGIADCDHWIRQPIEVSILAYTDSAGNVTIKIYDGYGTLPVGLNPFVLTGAIHPINNSTGLEFRAYVPTSGAAANKLIQIKMNDTFEKQNIPFDLFYDNKKVLSGILQKQ